MSRVRRILCLFVAQAIAQAVAIEEFGVLPHQYAFAAPEGSQPATALKSNMAKFSDDEPWQWLESGSSQAQQWLKEQDRQTRQLLNSIPGRSGLFQRIAHYKTGGTKVTLAERHGERYFYTKSDEGRQKLFVRDAILGKERLLVDPQRYGNGTGKIYKIEYIYGSPNGKYVAVGVSEAGNEFSTLHLIDAHNGSDLQSIPLAWRGSVSWLDDSSGFFYTKLPELDKDAPPIERRRREAVYLHIVGTPPSKDRFIFGFNYPGTSLNNPDIFFDVYKVHGSRWALGVVNQGVEPELELYITEVQNIISEAVIPWRKIASKEDSVTGYDLHQNSLFFMSHKDAERFKVLELDLKMKSSPKEIISESEHVINGICAAKDALYISDIFQGRSRIRRKSYSEKTVEVLKLPYDGVVRSGICNGETDGYFWRMESWVRPQSWFVYEPKREKILDSRIARAPSANLEIFESMEIEIPARDGAKIPVSIVWRKGTKRNSNNPLWLRAYGAYGIPLQPLFQPEKMPWLERGGIIAVAHVRGGGEKGDSWHRAGMGARKANSSNDVIDVAEYLINAGFTSSGLIGIDGGSAGAITVGGAMAKRPELFRVAVFEAGIFDALSFIQTEAGQPNKAEFGDPATTEGLKWLREMSPYLKLEQGKKYPATLMTGGFEDRTVPIWQSAKMTAKLQKFSPLQSHLLKVDYNAAHGPESAATEKQIEEEFGDQQVFMLWQMGFADFQPSQPKSWRKEGE